MAHSEICPICQGSGKAVPEGYWAGGPESYPTCHGCGGKGWIVISVQEIYPYDCNARATYGYNTDEAYRTIVL